MHSFCVLQIEVEPSIRRSRHPMSTLRMMWGYDSVGAAVNICDYNGTDWTKRTLMLGSEDYEYAFFSGCRTGDELYAMYGCRYYSENPIGINAYIISEDASAASAGIACQGAGYGSLMTPVRVGGKIHLYLQFGNKISLDSGKNWIELDGYAISVGPPMPTRNGIMIASTCDAKITDSIELVNIIPDNFRVAHNSYLASKVGENVIHTYSYWRDDTTAISIRDLRIERPYICHINNNFVESSDNTAQRFTSGILPDGNMVCYTKYRQDGLNEPTECLRLIDIRSPMDIYEIPAPGPVTGIGRWHNVKPAFTLV